MLHEERLEFDNGKNILVGILSMPADDSPIVILCHGLGSSKDSGMQLGLHNALAWHGIGTFRFDFTGHGESEGDFKETTLTQGIEDVKNAVAYLHERHPSSKLALCGHSYGGAAVFFATPEVRVAGTGCIAPNLHGQENRKKWMGQKKINDWKLKGELPYETFAGQKRTLSYEYFADYHKYAPEKVQFEVPVMLFHGKADKIVPFAQSQKVAKALKLKLKSYKADHNFNAKGTMDTMIHDVLDFFIETLGTNADETHGYVL